MKVFIGPYRSWIGPYQLVDMMFFWLEKWPTDEQEKRWDYRLRDRLSEWLASTWVTGFCQWIDEKKKRKINIKIDPYDTWSMDHTLALIIVPMLKQLNECKHGSPFVADEDVPNYLRSTNAKPKENEYDTDEFHHKRWDWVFEEMIWAFEQQIDEHSDEQFYTYLDDDTNSMPILGNKRIEVDREALKKWQERKSNGFRLFGKYYENLWD